MIIFQIIAFVGAACCLGMLTGELHETKRLYCHETKRSLRSGETLVTMFLYASFLIVALDGLVSSVMSWLA